METFSGFEDVVIIDDFFIFWIVVAQSLHVEDVFFHVFVAGVDAQMFFFELFFADDDNVSGVRFFDVEVDIFFADDVVVVVFGGLWLSQKIFWAQVVIVEEGVDFVCDFVFFEHLVVVFDDFADFVELDLVVFDDFFDIYSHIWYVAEELKHRDAFEEFVVVLVVEPAFDGEAVVLVEGVGDGAVVDDDDVFEVAAEFGEVLDEGGVDEGAVFAEEAEVEDVFFVDLVEQRVRVLWETRGEDDDFVELRHVLQKLLHERAHQDVDVVDLVFDVDLDDHVARAAREWEEVAVDQCFVEVEHERFFLVLGLREEKSRLRRQTTVKRPVRDVRVRLRRGDVVLSRVVAFRVVGRFRTNRVLYDVVAADVADDVVWDFVVCGSWEVNFSDDFFFVQHFFWNYLNLIMFLYYYYNNIIIK